jgi:NAD-dependent DNA ligase
MFDTVEIDGCEVSRASLHNPTFIKELELMPGCRILVSRRNMIIPHIEENLDCGNFDAEKLFPAICPCCGFPTRPDTKGATETLRCDNHDCAAQNLRKFVHFVGKKAMDIETVGNGFDFTQLNDFGEVLHNNIHEWFGMKENVSLWKELQKMINIEKKITTAETAENPFSGRTIVVTGKLEHFTRNGINAKIEELGAKAGSAVSKNTDYLIVGEKAGSKLDKARSLGVAVLTEQEFLSMAQSA